MDPAFESLYASPAYSGHTLLQEKRPRFLTAIGDLVNRSLKNPLRLKSQKSFDTSSESSESSSEPSRSTSRANSHIASADPTSWRPRGRTTDLDDYLSLDQLENIWQYQDDSFAGAISIPLSSSEYTFQEAVEAPTYVKHKRPEIDTSCCDKPLPNLDTPRPAEANILDGIVHPALRPQTPCPPEQQADDEIISTSQTGISAISTWTYKRQHVF